VYLRGPGIGETVRGFLSRWDLYPVSAFVVPKKLSKPNLVYFNMWHASNLDQAAMGISEEKARIVPRGIDYLPLGFIRPNLAETVIDTG
jgi:hypothetical protein